MPKLTIPERTFIVVKYFEAKSFVAVLRQFQIAFPGRNLHRAFGVMSTNTGCMHWMEHGRTTPSSLNRNKGNSGRRRVVLDMR
jgi:hypothetical protein